MKNVLVDRPSAQKLEKKSSPDLILDLNHDRLSKLLVDERPYYRRTKENPKHQNLKSKKRKASLQRSNQVTLPRFEIPQGAIAGIKWTVCSLMVVGIGAMALLEPSPSPKTQPSTTPQSEPISPVEMPDSSLSESWLQPSATSLPESSLLKEGLTSQSPNPNSFSNNQNQAANPTPEPIPTPATEALDLPSPPGNGSVVPPSVPLNLPASHPPCLPGGMGHELALPATEANTNINKDAQAAQVRSRFQSSWQPPSGLQQTLEYSVLLNADGTIQRIIPLSNAAANHIDRTNIPVAGTQLVSATEGVGKTNVHLAFSPNGTVKASLQ
jgi:hypothetical protein